MARPQIQTQTQQGGRGGGYSQGYGAGRGGRGGYSSPGSYNAPAYGQGYAQGAYGQQYGAGGGGYGQAAGGYGYNSYGSGAAGGYNASPGYGGGSYPAQPMQMVPMMLPTGQVGFADCQLQLCCLLSPLLVAVTVIYCACCPCPAAFWYFFACFSSWKGSSVICRWASWCKALAVHQVAATAQIGEDVGAALTAAGEQHPTETPDNTQQCDRTHLPCML